MIVSLVLNGLFTNNAVFPHHKAVKIFGEGEGSISVFFNGNGVTTEAINGKWSVTLPPMECGGPYVLSVSDGKTTVKLHDIYVGEVILVCGQSNMQLKLHESKDGNEASRSDPLMRLYTVDRPEAGEYFSSSDGWIKCERKSAGYWTAIGYYIADEISRTRNIAVGIIACYQGASMIQSWLPEHVVKDGVYHIPPELRHADFRHYPIWNGDGFLYENMLRKLFPYSINRVVYYQGESNTTTAEGAIYCQLLEELIQVLRRGFDDRLLNVTVVQIADLESRNDEGWKAIQAAQLRVMNPTNHVRTVISADICESDSIHPPTKKPLAQRIVNGFS